MDENDPVDDTEFVYRRIHPNYYDATLAMPVGREAFRPTQNDTTGLSVLRAKFAQPTDTLVGGDPAKVANYHVARLAVRDLRTLELTVRPEPTPGGPPGHAVIAELNWSTYEANKQQWKPVLVKLATLASADVVH